MVKQGLKSVLRKTGYDFVRYVEIPVQPFSVLPYVVAEQLQRDPQFFFLQIGANDGVVADPIHDLVRKYNLAGLLVEPLPDLFERLKANYADQPRVAFERCAIGREDGEASLYRVRADAPLPRWAHSIASFDRGHLRGHLKGIKNGISNVEQYVEEVKVPSLKLSTLLRKHGIHDLTLLQVDTEGFDCEIVRMALEAGLRPAIINYEFLHARRQDQSDCKKRLMDAGYRFVDIGRDTLAVRRP
jgi:FkbM family methyltransferase